VLLARGMTPKSFSEVSRSAFVHAAAVRSRLRNGRINYSRVAAQTGITRADVRRLLSQDKHSLPAAPDGTPVERVIRGWRSDRQFSRNVGKPNPLRISGSDVSFTLLARKYAGDVPYRAVLNELERMGAVIIEGDLVHLRTRLQFGAGARFGSLAAVVPVLIDSLRIASDTRARSSASIQRLLIPAQSEMDLAFIRERCTSTARAMLDGLGHSMGKSYDTRQRKHPNTSFAVTILLTEKRPKTGRHENIRLPGKA
jgi:hypothetical protein